MKDDAVELRPRPMFPLGQVLATPAVLKHFGAQQGRIGVFLARHATGDWGDSTDIDAEAVEANHSALTNEERILSVYRFKDRKFWILTEADRSVTTVFFPEEY